MAKKKIPFIKYTVSKFEDYETLTSLAETKRKVFDRLIESVKDGLTSKKDSVEIFRIYDSDTILHLEKSKWKTSLERAIDFYIEIEDYIKCKECKELIDKI